MAKAGSMKITKRIKNLRFVVSVAGRVNFSFSAAGSRYKSKSRTRNYGYSFVPIVSRLIIK